MRYSEDLHGLASNIVRIIKSIRLRWGGRVAGIDDSTISFNISSEIRQKKTLAGSRRGC